MSMCCKNSAYCCYLLADCFAFTMFQRVFRTMDADNSGYFCSFELRAALFILGKIYYVTQGRGRKLEKVAEGSEARV